MEGICSAEIGRRKSEMQADDGRILDAKAGMLFAE